MHINSGATDAIIYVRRFRSRRCGKSNAKSFETLRLGGLDCSKSAHWGCAVKTHFFELPALKCRLLASAAIAAILSGVLFAPEDAAALPSFARQTGQPCASCHTAFPELTPFGRRFKLGGYTLEGGDSKLPPIAAMVQSTFTNYARSLDAPMGNYTPRSPNGGFANNNNIDLSQQVSIFYGGKIYGNLGAFVQTTFNNGYGRTYSLDLADIRYADTAKIGNLDFLFGFTANNAPGVQDVWNTTPQWNFPYIKSAFALSPAAGTMIESWGSSQAAGAGAYVFAHDLVYAELSAYGSLSRNTQTTLGVSPPNQTFAIQGLAPYWRLAIEPNWGNNSLMLGTFGMAANIGPAGDFSMGTDRITDIGLDAQYQWIGDLHAVTARASYIYERQQLGASFGLGNSANPSNDLRSFKASVSYIYDHMISLTGAYTLTTGSADAFLYTSNLSSSPNSESWTADLAFLPFSKGGPGFWPWANTRIGLTYTYWTKFNGAKYDIDFNNCPGCRNARDNNTLMLYAFTAF